MHSRRARISSRLLLALLVILVILDRVSWARIAQWREDQATNLWLGYTVGIGHAPVGLISSQSVPNPNGMVLLGSVLSLLPGLLWVSIALGMAQALLLLLLGWKAAAGCWRFAALAALPALGSVVLRSSSVEFWNQYTITLINLFFLFWALRYLEKPSLWNLPPIATLILLAPALYLAGAVNAVVMLLLTLGMLAYRRPVDWKHRLPVAAILAAVLAVAILITWRPYFQHITLQQLAGIKQEGPRPFAALTTFCKSLVTTPILGTFQWADPSVVGDAFKHSDHAILARPTQLLLALVRHTYLLQAMFACAVALFALYRRCLHKIPPSADPAAIPARRLAVLSIAFVTLSFPLSTGMGGPDWLAGARPDQLVQFLPLFLFFVFLLPAVIRVGGAAGRTITGISHGLLALFVVLNLLCGFATVRDHLGYQGAVLTEADIPLVDKQQALAFIARDWKARTPARTIPIDYDLGGGRWDRVAQFGDPLTRWYPAPMTAGRGFDYELLRRYGLSNTQEGVQFRTFGTGRYLLTYAFKDPPQTATGRLSHTQFGRLRVSIVE